MEYLIQNTKLWNLIVAKYAHLKIMNEHAVKISCNKVAMMLLLGEHEMTKSNKFCQLS